MYVILRTTPETAYKCFVDCSDAPYSFPIAETHAIARDRFNALMDHLKSEPDHLIIRADDHEGTALVLSKSRMTAVYEIVKVDAAWRD